MTMSHEGRSAQIYQFPARGRFAAGNRSDESKSGASIAPSRLATVAFGGNWYHEEAVREAERVRQG
jgi:hypothetical protein